MNHAGGRVQLVDRPLEVLLIGGHDGVAARRVISVVGGDESQRHRSLIQILGAVMLDCLSIVIATIAIISFTFVIIVIIVVNVVVRDAAVPRPS